MTKKHKVMFVLASTAVAIFVGIVTFTNICEIQAVTLNGNDVSDWYNKSNLKLNKSVLRQPLAEYVRQSLSGDRTLKVDISYNWPHTLNVEFNSISPACLILDKKSGTIYGLDESCRTIPLKDNLVDWERPLFTGIKVEKLYELCSDVRSRDALVALNMIRKERMNFYRLIEQIDFSSRDHLVVTVAGHDHAIWVRSQFFYEDINRYVDFAARYNLELDLVKIIDLRQSGQIVAKQRKS